MHGTDRSTDTQDADRHKNIASHRQIQAQKARPRKRQAAQTETGQAQRYMARTDLRQAGTENEQDVDGQSEKVVNRFRDCARL